MWKYIQTNSFTDYASMLMKARQFAKKDVAAVFVLLSNLQLTHLEEQLLTNILPEGTFKLPLAPVLGVNIPESLSSISWGEPTPLSYLYQLDEAGEESVSIRKKSSFKKMGNFFVTYTQVQIVQFVL